VRILLFIVEIDDRYPIVPNPITVETRFCAVTAPTPIAVTSEEIWKLNV
jgi:hypothetical protein